MHKSDRTQSIVANRNDASSLALKVEKANFTSGARHGAHDVRGTYATLPNDVRGTLHSARGVMVELSHESGRESGAAGSILAKRSSAHQMHVKHLMSNPNPNLNPNTNPKPYSIL